MTLITSNYMFPYYRPADFIAAIEDDTLYNNFRMYEACFQEMVLEMVGGSDKGKRWARVVIDNSMILALRCGAKKEFYDLEQVARILLDEPDE